MTAPADLDPITLEILANALRSVTDESFAALMRSAYSTNIKERHDHSTTIMDREGRVIATERTRDTMSEQGFGILRRAGGRRRAGARAAPPAHPGRRTDGILL